MSVFIKEFISGFKEFGKFVNAVVLFVALTLVYIFGIGPTSLIGKLLGKKFLSLKKDEKAKTYWTDNRIGKKKEEEYYNTF